jgi:hypothetical protein
LRRFFFRGAHQHQHRADRKDHQHHFYLQP